MLVHSYCFCYTLNIIVNGGVPLVRGFQQVDVHGMNRAQAFVAIDALLRRADGAVYTVRVIHGYHGGTVLRDWIWERYGKGGDLKVKRVEPGSNPGVSDLVLREY